MNNTNYRETYKVKTILIVYLFVWITITVMFKKHLSVLDF